LDKIGTGTSKQDMTENLNQCQLVFAVDVKQVPTPSEWNHKFHCRADGRCECIHNLCCL